MRISILFVLMVMSMVTMQAQTDNADWQDVSNDNDTVRQDTIPNRDEEENTYSPLEQFLPPSPQAAALARYGEYPVSLSTGVPEIKIPLYEIKLGNYTLPISISYHASGIKADDIASTVGLGWVLNAGGVVSRTICGAPDLRGTTNEQETYYHSYTNLNNLINQTHNDGTNLTTTMDILLKGVKADYDTASDRYCYNFGTKAGVFRYLHGRGEYVPLNHHSILITAHSGTTSWFSIIDTDGTKYDFKAKEYTYLKEDDNTCPVTAWYISEIHTPYGTISFTYEQAPDFYTYSYSETCQVGEFLYYDDTNHCAAPQWKAHSSLHRSDYLNRTLLLKKIEWNGNHIDFTYSSRNDVNWKRLTQIKVKGCDGQTYKTINLNNNTYLGSSSADNLRMILSSISLSDEGTYSFEYNSTQFPAYYKGDGDTSVKCHTDFWGYYNGRNTVDFIPQSYLNLVISQYPGHGISKSSNANRNPSFTYTKAGILEKVTYPTGGYSRYYYAQNHVGDYDVGGLRIDSIGEFTSSGTILTKRKFSYIGKRTQDLPYTPRYYNTYHYYIGVAIGDCECIRATCTSDPLIPLTDGSGSPVIYTSVTETNLLSGHRTVYQFMNGCIYDLEGMSQENIIPQLNFQNMNDEGSCNPLMTSHTVYNGNNVLESESFTYTQHRMGDMEMGAKALFLATISDIYGTYYSPGYNNLTTPAVPRGSMTAHIKTYTLDSKTLFREGVSTTETYTYDPQFRTLQPKTITKTNSDGKVFKTTNTYTFESNQQPYTTMANYYNMVDQIIETRDSCDNTLLKTKKTTYLYQNDWYYPEFIYESLLNNTQTEKLHLSDYDSHGNPRTVIENGSDKTALVWGFKHSWPVAKVSGLSYSDLTDLGLISTLNNIAQDSVPSRMANYLTTLRSGIGTNGLVTTYNYKPLYGVSAITAESGYTTYYDYGSNGKLSAIRDSRGPIQQYSYKYAHPYSGSNDTTNFVRTTDMLSSSTGKITCQYYDGLGRPIETAKNINGKYVYTLQKYDAKGRVSEDWLPAPNNTTLSYLSSIASISSSFYTDNHAYSLTTYDALDRPTFIQSPGNAWHSASKGISKQYLSNTANSVKRYQASLSNSNIIMNGMYAVNTLYAEKTIDEDSRAVTVFSDKLGRKILERRGADNDTYFVYDDLGQLRFVMPPEVASYYENNSSQSFSAQSNVMLQYGYEYRYDSRHNCIYKRLPGCDPIYYVYDKADRCILSQDGEQRNSGKWSFHIPDVYGRTVLTGTCTNSIVYTSEPLKNVVVKASRTTPSGSIYGYSVSGFSPSLQSVYSVNYYDDYSFVGNGLAPTSLAYTTPPTEDYGTQGLTAPRGLLTGTSVGRITSSGVSGMNYTAIYYDDKGRIIQTRGTNHMGGTDYEYTGYTYTDKVQKRQHVHSASGMSTQTETYTYDYNNNTGLLETTKHKLNTNSEVTLHQYTYNELGQMTQKTNGGISSAAETYTYNVRSWLKTISSTLFNETLYYNDTYGGSTAQYGGNVSAMTWKADNNTRGYKFTYDNFSRLTKAQYMSNGNTSSYYTTEYTYDRMGNMLTLKRNGMMNSTAFPPIDYLTFTYSGNQVTRIDDSGYTPTYTGAFNFVNGASQSNEYTYDKNGNLTKDLNKNISSIQYNFLNLPANITYSSGKSAAYIYDANGQKLRTSYKASASATAVPTDYCGNMIYENGVLKQVLVDGGYMTVTGTPFYFYYLKDHLGSNRVVVSPAGTATQINHYYPFGGLFGESTGNTGQRYKYNGKEFDRTHGLDWYDYGARHMSPDVGRFTTIDPMAEKYYNISPYAYCANNPMNIIDPTGMIWENPEEAKELENNIEDRISSLNKNIQKLEMKILRGGLSEKKTSKYNDKIEDLREQISNLNQSIEDIHLLGKDSHIYAFANVDGGRHSVYNSDGKIYIERSSDAFAIHEITHIRQSLMSGGLSFNSSGYLLNIGSPKNYQMMADTEIEAYQKQYSYDNSFPGQVHSLHSINLKSVGNIRDEKGGIVYNSIYNYYKYLQTVNKLMGK